MYTICIYCFLSDFLFSFMSNLVQCSRLELEEEVKGFSGSGEDVP